MKSQNTFRPTCHVDGTVTVWDAHRQCWLRRVKPQEISEPVLASLSPSDRERVLRHKEIGVVVGEHSRYIFRRLTKAEEAEFYRRTGNGPVAMTLPRPKQEPQPDHVTQPPDE